MEQKELCQWLREHSAGTYRPSAEAADEIERLQHAFHKHDVALALLCDGGIASQALFDVGHRLQSLPQEKWAAEIVKRATQLALQETASLPANAQAQPRACRSEAEARPSAGAPCWASLPR